MKSQQFNRVYNSGQTIPMSHNAMISVPNRFNVSRRNKDFIPSPLKNDPDYLVSRPLVVLPDKIDEQYAAVRLAIQDSKSSYHKSRRDKRKGKCLGPKNAPMYSSPIGPLPLCPNDIAKPDRHDFSCCPDDFDVSDLSCPTCVCLGEVCEFCKLDPFSSFYHSFRMHHEEYDDIDLTCEDSGDEIEVEGCPEEAIPYVPPSVVDPQDEYDTAYPVAVWQANLDHFVPESIPYSDFRRTHQRPFVHKSIAWYLSQLYPASHDEEVRVLFRQALLRYYPTYSLSAHHYCAECNCSVLVCKHLISDFVPSLAIALHSEYSAELREFFSLDIREEEWPRGADNYFLSFCGYYGAAPFYSAWKGYWCASDDRNPVLRINLRWFESVVFASYPKRIRAEVGENVLDSFTSAISSIRAALLDTFSMVTGPLAQKIMDFLGILLACMVDPRIMAGRMYESIRENVLSKCPDFVQSIPLLSLLKTCVRYWLGASPILLITELLWDTSFMSSVDAWTSSLRSAFWATFAAMKDKTALVTDSISSYFRPAAPGPIGNVFNAAVDAPIEAGPPLPINIEVEGPSEFVALFGIIGAGLLCTGAYTEYNTGYVRKLFQNIVLCASASQRVGLADIITDVTDYFSGSSPEIREMIRLKKTYPGTMAFIEFHANLPANPFPSDLAKLQTLYAAYLRENDAAARDDVQPLRARALNALAFVKDHRLQPCASSRKQPNCYVFKGPPGIGKSTIANYLYQLLGEAMARDMKQRGHGDPQPSDFLHTLDPMDKFCSGYRPTRNVWQIDDAFQARDTTASPANTVDMMFRLVTPNAIVLPMAAVEDKGMEAVCDVIVASTNCSMTTDWMMKNISSICNPDALRRRFTHVITPHLLPPFSYDKDRKRIINEKGEIHDGAMDFETMYSFEVVGTDDKLIRSPSGKLGWKFNEIVTHAYRSMVACRDYVPVQGGKNDLVYCQGWTDVFSVFGVKSCTCAHSYDAHRTCKCASGNVVHTFAKDFYAMGRSGIVKVQTLLDLKPTTKPSSIFSLTDYTPGRSCSHCSSLSDDPNPCFTCLGDSRRFADAFSTHQGKFYFVGDEADMSSGFNNFLADTLVGQYYEIVEPPPEWRLTFALCISVILSGIGAFFLAKKIVQSGATLCEDLIGRVTKQGKDYVEGLWLTPDPEGRIEFDQGGQKFVTITYANGMKKTYIRSEGPGAPKFQFDKHARLFMPRVEQQLPSYRQNLYTVVTNDTLVGNVFFLDSRTAIGPHHIAKYMQENDFTLLGEGDRKVFSAPANLGVYKAPEGDFACIEFLSESIPTVKKIKNRICDAVPSTGSIVFLHRDEKGIVTEQPGTFVHTQSSAHYSYSEVDYAVPAKSVRIATGPISQRGSCGGIYITRSDVQSKSLYGFHVGSLDDSKYVHTIDVGWLNSLRLYNVPDTHPPMDASPPRGQPFSAVGFPVGKAPFVVVPTRGKARQFSHLTSKYVDASVAPVSLFKNGDMFIMPPLVATAKLKKRFDTPEPDLRHMFEFVAALAKQFDHVPTRKRTMDEVAAAAVCGLPSIDRSAVPGPGYSLIGPTKAIMFEEGDVVKLTKDAKQMIDYALGIICPYDWSTRDRSEFGEFYGPTSYNMKDESRPTEKAEIGATRPYMVTSFIDFILQRAFFYDFCDVLMRMNLAYCSALGIDPHKWTQFSEILFERAVAILTADFQYMDGSFSPIIGQLCAWFIISIYGNEGSEFRFVHPDIPPLNRDNFIRWSLIDRLMRYRTIFGDEEVCPERSHPSGSFLTTILNIVWQIIMWFWIFCSFHSMSVPGSTPIDSVPGIRKKYRNAFLGDDSVIAALTDCFPSAEFIVAEARRLGFTLTGSVKDQPIKWQNPWTGVACSDFTFLSRKFCSLNGHVVGLLVPDRMFKMLLFCNDPKKMAEVYPSVVVNFIHEFRLWLRYGRDKDVIEEGRRLLCLIGGAPLINVYEKADSSVITSCVLDMITNNPLLFEFKDRPEIVVEGPGDPKGKEKEKSSEHAVTYTKYDAVIDECATSSAAENVEAAEFAENQPTVVADMSEHLTNWVYSGMCTEKFDISRILSKPRVIASGTTGLHAANHKIGSWVGPYQYFHLNPDAFAYLFQYMFFRCTMCYKLVVSGSPMTSGLVVFSARYGTTGPSHVYESASDVSIEVSACSGSSAVIKCPTILPHGWSINKRIDPSTDIEDSQEFNFVIASLFTLTANSQPITYTIYAWMEDVDVRMPRVLDVPGPVPIAVQGLQNRVQTIKEMSEDVFSVANRGIATASGVVTSVINIIDTAAKFAALVGLSAPAYPTPGMFMNPGISAPHLPHMLGPVLTTRMSIAQEQKTVQPQGTWGCMGDDMDIRKVCSRPGIVAVGNWTSSGFITSLPIGPGIHNTIASYTHWSHLAWVSRFFRLWRGTINVRISLDKTAMHSGELIIVYQPWWWDDEQADANSYALNHRIIWDTNMSSSIEFKVPYSSPLPWTDVFYDDGNSPSSPGTNHCANTGVIYIYGQTAPVIPADVGLNAAVPYIIYTWSDDIEFAMPAMSDIVAPPIDVEIGPWSDAAPNGETCDTPKYMYYASRPSPITNSSCVGEAIPNLRLLTRRLEKLKAIPDLTSTTISHKDLYISYAGLPRMIPEIARMYLHFSGGFRVALVGTTDGTFISYVRARRLFRNDANFPLAIQYHRTDRASVNTYDIPWQAPVPFTYIEPYAQDVIPDYTMLDSLVLNTDGRTLADGDIFICGADDFTFGCLIAPPSTSSAKDPIQNPPAVFSFQG